MHEKRMGLQRSYEYARKDKAVQLGTTGGVYISCHVNLLNNSHSLQPAKQFVQEGKVGHWLVQNETRKNTAVF